MPSVVRNLRFVLTGEDKSASKALKGLSKNTEDFRSGISKATKVAAVGLAGVAAAGVKLEAEFSATMNQMAAVAGVPAKGIEELSALAMKMGADTVFSASDAADAMLELAKGGLTAAQIQAGALAATLQLAAAGGLELGAAATFMSNAMNTFGLQAKDAAKVSAALAGGANASSASVESLGQALAQVGPGAKTAGLSLEETVAVLAAFDNAGIKGSDAGTSLKTMLTRLVPQTDKAAGAMADLGLKFTNAEGEFDDIATISEKLRKQLSKLSAEERTTALATIFGSDATRAATVLMGEGAAGIQKYTKATSDLGAAQRVADARMKGTAGSLEALKGSAETAALAIGQMLAPFVQTLAKHLTSLANGFTKNKDILVPLIAVLTTFAATVWAINKAVAAVRATTAAYTAVKGLLTAATVAETKATTANTVAVTANTAATGRAAVASGALATSTTAAAAGIGATTAAATAGIAVFGAYAAAAAAATAGLYAFWKLATKVTEGGGDATFAPYDPNASGGTNMPGFTPPVPKLPAGTKPKAPIYYPPASADFPSSPRRTKSGDSNPNRPSQSLVLQVDQGRLTNAVTATQQGRGGRGYLGPS